MGTSVSWNGLSYFVPATGDQNWSGSSDVDGLLISLAENGFQKTGGLFTLSTDSDFGPTNGLTSVYFKSRSSNIAQSGILRLANGDAVSFRNAGNSADLPLTVNSSNQLTFNGNVISGSSGFLGPMTTLGDTIYGAASGLATRLAGNTGSTKNFLVQTGTGSVSAAPVWGTIAAGDLPAVTTTPTASTYAGWDANKNLSANNLIDSFTTTATAAGTTTLTVSSTAIQVFTGSTTQTVTMPVASTLALGQTFTIINLSTGAITVQSSGSNTIQAMAANTQLVLTCQLTSGTGTASWVWNYNPAQSSALSVVQGGTGISAASAGDLLYGSASNTLSRLTIGSSGQILAVSGGLPVWQSTTNTVSISNKTGNYTLLSTDDVITADTSGGAFTLTIPAASSNSGKVFRIKLWKVNSTTSNALTIARSGSDTFVDGVTGLTSTTLNTTGEEIEVVSDGTSVWYLLNRRIPANWSSSGVTLTFSAGFGTVSTSSYYWRRIGSELQVRGYGITGTTAASTTSIGIPLTLDSTKMPSATNATPLGAFYLTGNVGGVGLFYDGSDTANIYIGGTYGTTSGFTKINSTGLFGSVTGYYFSFNFSVPISGWNG